MTLLEFRRDFWRQKTRVLWLSYGVVRVILRLAVLIQYQRVTDTRRRVKTGPQLSCYYSRRSDCGSVGLKPIRDKNRPTKAGPFIYAYDTRSIFRPIFYTMAIFLFMLCPPGPLPGLRRWTPLGDFRPQTP